MADSTRWPVLAATARQPDVASSLCYALFVYEPAHWSPLGTFNMYGATPDGFSGEDQEFGSILAAYLAVAEPRHSAVTRGGGTSGFIDGR